MNYNKIIMSHWLFGILIGLILIAASGAVGYYFGYDVGFEKAAEAEINSFEECAAVYPVMESYPEQCLTPDGRSFTRQIDQPIDPDGPVACTMEAKLCPDGSAVGRTGPNCEFAPCPGE